MWKMEYTKKLGSQNDNMEKYLYTKLQSNYCSSTENGLRW